MPQPARFLSLPPELRQQIWDIYYTAIKPPHVRYVISAQGGIIAPVTVSRSNLTLTDSTSRDKSTTSPAPTHDIDFRPAHVCKLFHGEAWAAIWRHCRLYIAPRQGGQPSSATYHESLWASLPSYITDNIQHVAWQLNSLDDLAEAPPAPERGWRTFETLREEAARLYQRMSHAERLAQWFAMEARDPTRPATPPEIGAPLAYSAEGLMAAVMFNAGGKEVGWLRGITNLGDPVTADETAVPYSYDGHVAGLQTLAEKVDIKLEVALHLLGGGPWFGVPTPVVSEPVLVVVDAKRRVIESARQLRREENEYRQKRALSTYAEDYY
ncbi:hypothetical protein Micbo1qcDRAFT_207768 [Microdochium bolleyi]|uniref:Uncharacterized protein n=1 Tax=Microdochium bolleyi TaxID=196109 RepID=A0A136IT14_9PEZI|nr:hypothetical protein Micbo1qcDRAFT_207768 [Microdochium bolleyi]